MCCHDLIKLYTATPAVDSILYVLTVCLQTAQRVQAALLHLDA